MQSQNMIWQASGSGRGDDGYETSVPESDVMI